MEFLATVVYGWTLLTAIITKNSIIDLAGQPRYTSFASNSKTLKRHSCEFIAVLAKFPEAQLTDSCPIFVLIL